MPDKAVELETVKQAIEVQVNCKRDCPGFEFRDPGVRGCEVPCEGADLVLGAPETAGESLALGIELCTRD